MAINRATWIEEDDDRILAEVAAASRWSISQTIAELVRESPRFIKKKKKLLRKLRTSSVAKT